MNTAVPMVWRMGPKYGLQESSRNRPPVFVLPGSRRPTVSGRVAVIRRGGRSLWFIRPCGPVPLRPTASSGRIGIRVGRPSVRRRGAAHAETADLRAVQDLVRVRANPVDVERASGQACSVCALQCDGRAGRHRGWGQCQAGQHARGRADHCRHDHWHARRACLLTVRSSTFLRCFTSIASPSGLFLGS